MTMDEINKRYEELKYTKTCIERAMEKFRGTNNIDNYLSYDVLRYQAGILGHSMTEMKAFFTSGFNTLKIKSMVLRLHFEYLQKKVDHCNVIFYKYHVEDI